MQAPEFGVRQNDIAQSVGGFETRPYVPCGIFYPLLTNISVCVILRK
jgi:hypothetical protein